jgi:hypothetical protein
MPKSFLSIFAALFAVVLFGIGEGNAQSAAPGAGWRLSEVSGVVRVLQPGVALAPGTKDQVLAVGSTITTGANGSATIENGAQRIIISGNSRTTIAPDTGSGVSRILQDVGSALFQVDRREAPHFRVETPLLAAVVKGTTFTVTAGPQEDVVHVARGLVAVSANGNGNGGASTRDVAAGETARVLRASPGQLALAMPASRPPTIAGVALPPIDYAKVSGDVIDGKSSLGASDTRPPSAQSNRDDSPGRNDIGLDSGAISLVVLDTPVAAARLANDRSDSAGNGSSGSGGGNSGSSGGGNSGSGGGGNSGSGGGGGNNGSGGGGNSGSGGGGNGGPGGRDSD